MSDFALVPFNDTNQEPRCACVLLVDTSSSMSEAGKIASLNEGLRSFQKSLLESTMATLRVEVAVVSFSSHAQIEHDFALPDVFIPPTLVASGSTAMGQGIVQALEMIEERKQIYKLNGLAYYRPWIFMITDGAPTDSVTEAAQRVHIAEQNKKVAFFSVGVQDADMDLLEQISVRKPLKLKGMHFGEMFLWLSASLILESNSNPGDQVALPPPGWGSID